MSTLFSKIIAGEIPSYKIYEDDKTFAFLDINPETRGHTLVVPKFECDKIYDLPDDFYQAVWATAQKLAKHYDQILGRRCLFKVIGTDVPHAHIHIIPFEENYQPGQTLTFSEAEFREIQDQLKLN